jgi:hypothetical protein
MMIIDLAISTRFLKKGNILRLRESNPFLAISSLSFSASSQASSETFFSCLQEEKKESFHFNFPIEDCQWHFKKISVRNG